MAKASLRFSLISPVGVERTVASEQEKARELVLQFGWNTTCYQVVNPGIERWFSSEGDAMVGYVAKKGRRVVAGAPICSLERLPSVIEQWRLARPDRPTCYFGAE